MANGFIDGIGYPMNGGLSAGLSNGLALSKERERLEKTRGLASGFNKYYNAENDEAKKAAMAEIAQYSPETAYNLMKFDRDWQISPYQQATLDLQNKQLERQGKMTDYQNWQVQEMARKEAEAKEKEKLVGEAINEFVTAADDNGKMAALGKMAKIDPSFAQGFYDKATKNQITPYQQEMLDIRREMLEAQKEKLANQASGFGNTEMGLMLDVLENPEKYDERTVQFVEDYMRVKRKDPSLRGSNEFEGQRGKMYAEAGQPYGGSYGYNQQQNEENGLEQPVIPITSASLAADKKRAEKEAENRVSVEKDLAQAGARLDAYDALINDVKQSEDILGKMNAINYNVGEWTNGLFGLENEDRQKYASIRRQIGEIRSNLIARARAAGQVGINTAKEIELAAAGVDFDMSAPSLIGAIEQLKKQEIRLNNAIAEHYGLGGVKQQPDDDVISVDEWIKQGR